ncbi:MAG: hypothetical protein ACRD88_09400, partial [Terriglobia bacterium]
LPRSRRDLLISSRERGGRAAFTLPRLDAFGQCKQVPVTFSLQPHLVEVIVVPEAMQDDLGLRGGVVERGDKSR